VLETFLEVSESLFSSTFAFLMMSLASQKSRPFNADFKLAGKNQLKPIQEYMGGHSNVVKLFFGKKSLTKIDRCGGAFS
jgi:hypothetical protein